MNKEKGLFSKYYVGRVDGKPMGESFVLEPARDPIAVEALFHYASIAHDRGYEVLAKDIFAMLNRVEKGA